MLDLEEKGFEIVENKESLEEKTQLSCDIVISNWRDHFQLEVLKKRRKVEMYVPIELLSDLYKIVFKQF